MHKMMQNVLVFYRFGEGGALGISMFSFVLEILGKKLSSEIIRTSSRVYLSFKNTIIFSRKRLYF